MHTLFRQTQFYVTTKSRVIESTFAVHSASMQQHLIMHRQVYRII